jgi:hypothetical protein
VTPFSVPFLLASVSVAAVRAQKAAVGRENQRLREIRKREHAQRTAERLRTAKRNMEEVTAMEVRV